MMNGNEKEPQPDLVVSDAGPLISLSTVNQLDLLEVMGLRVQPAQLDLLEVLDLRGRLDLLDLLGQRAILVIRDLQDLLELLDLQDLRELQVLVLVLIIQTHEIGMFQAMQINPVMVMVELLA